MIAMRQHGIDPDTIDTVLLSHLHGDHFGGVPLILLEAQFVSRRTRPLVVAGPPGTRDRLWQAMEVLFPRSSEIAWEFPLEIVELAAGRADPFGGLSVLPIEVVHPSGAPAYALRLSHDGQIIAYSGDTEWTDALPTVAHDADLFIMECYAYNPVSKFHMDYQTLCEHLPDLRAKRMVLTHMGPEMLDRLDRVDIETAYDGMVIELSQRPVSLARPRQLHARRASGSA